MKSRITSRATAVTTTASGSTKSSKSVGFGGVISEGVVVPINYNTTNNNNNNNNNNSKRIGAKRTRSEEHHHGHNHQYKKKEKFQVMVPRKMMYYTMIIFLVIPLLAFFYNARSVSSSSVIPQVENHNLRHIHRKERYHSYGEEDVLASKLGIAATTTTTEITTTDDNVLSSGSVGDEELNNENEEIEEEEVPFNEQPQPNEEGNREEIKEGGADIDPINKLIDSVVEDSSLLSLSTTQEQLEMENNEEKENNEEVVVDAADEVNQMNDINYLQSNNNEDQPIEEDQEEMPKFVGIRNTISEDGIHSLNESTGQMQQHNTNIEDTTIDSL